MLPVAIDISDTIIRLIGLERRGRSWKIHVRSEIAVAPGFINDGDIQQPAQVSELLHSLAEASDLHSKDVVITLPERHTFVKLITLPAGDNKAIPELVATTMTQHIPYNPDEMYWDWERVNSGQTGTDTRILLGAAPRTTVDQYLSVFSEAGLRVTVAEIESLAIVRALFGPKPPDEPRIIVDLGRTRSTLILIHHGVVQFSRTLRYAGRELNRFIADELHISDDQAERAKTLFGLDATRGKGLLRAVLAPHIDAIANGIAEVENFFEEHYVDHEPILKIHLTGSGAILRNIDRELQMRLKQVVVVEPSWVYTELLKSHRDLSPELGYSYTTAFGLAIRPWLTTQT